MFLSTTETLLQQEMHVLFAFWDTSVTLLLSLTQFILGIFQVLTACFEAVRQGLIRKS